MKLAPKQLREIEQKYADMTGVDIIEVIDRREGRYPDAGEGACCMGAAVYGPGGCTCWVRVHDLDQAAPQLDAPAGRRKTMCGDCAFRPGSPELTDDEHAVADSTDLAMIVADPAKAFWCHDGMRAVTAERHEPSGVTVDRPPVDSVVAYDPPIIDGRPYRADGTPGLLCAGLLAARARAQRGTP